jgi:hypothetical protein
MGVDDVHLDDNTNAKFNKLPSFLKQLLTMNLSHLPSEPWQRQL